MARSRTINDSPSAAGCPTSVVPAGTPAWVTAELIERTLEVWQPYYEGLLTPQDAVALILTVGQLFSVLSGRPES